ncbi:MAG TPA: hypothetical protein PKL78_06230 [Anaerolineales bacterium]|nr:hypothetical protein [Anaerolineales bacterium]HNO30702.1 hypothetical protein [Anaerolineales bacterium]
MERITIRVNDKSKARLLRDFLKSLDYVDKVTISKFRPSNPIKGKQSDFFAMAGVWAKRDISLEEIRKSAWSGRI